MDRDMKSSIVKYLCGSIVFSMLCALMMLDDSIIEHNFEGITKFILLTIAVEMLLICLFLLWTRQTWIAFFSQYGSAWRLETNLLLTRLPAVSGIKLKILELEFERLPNWREKSRTNPHLYAPHQFARFAIKDFHEAAKNQGKSPWDQEEVDRVVNYR